MASFTEHITTENERWDNIAYAAYGDAGAINSIIEANPTVPIVPLLPAGIRLQIPIVESVAVEIDETIMPPWK